MDFANEVKQLRVSKNWKQSDLAKLVGISRSSVAAIEAGVMIPETMAAMTLIGLAKAFGRPPLYFLLSSGLVKEEETGLKEGRFITLPKYFTPEDVAIVESLVSFITATYSRSARYPVINIIQSNPKEPEPQILGRPGDRQLDPWEEDLNERYRQEFKDQIEEWLSRQNLAG